MYKVKFYVNFLIAIFLLLIDSKIIMAQSKEVEWRPVKGHIISKWAKKVSPNHVLTKYPRPQLKRENWLNLNGLWDYAILPKRSKQPTKFDGKILVPFPIESALSGVGKKVGETKRLWYKRNFSIPEKWTGKNIILHFEAVDWETKVYFNGHYLGTHKGGYDHFSFDITNYIKHEGLQELVVSVWDPTDKGTQPRGKQVQNPKGIMYTSVTGIWQTVWLEPVPEHFIGNVIAVPNIDSSIVNVSSACVRINLHYKLLALIKAKGKEVAKGTWGIGETKKIHIPNEILWSPANPFLYDMDVYLIDSNNKIVDSVQSYFGMRKISVGKDDKGIERILLNNKFVFELGVLDQGWWPGGLYTAPSDEAMKHDIEMTKKMGFNLIRKHVKIEPERWYYWCDKLGMLVWQDMPSGDSSISPGQPDMQRTIESSDEFQTELTQMMEQHINHPSIILWVLYNEGWGQWNTIKMTNYVKFYDPSRLVDQASGWVDRGTGDIRDMHSYPGPAMPEPEKYRAVVLGEFGGLGYPIKDHTWEKENNWGYVVFKNIRQLRDAYSNLIDKLMLLKEKGLSAAVYTQLTDVESEVNGLMTYDRSIVKMGVDFLDRINSGYLPPLFITENSVFLKKLEVKLKDPSGKGTIRYTTNGSEPNGKSAIYKNPIVLISNCILKAKTFWNDGTSSTVSEERFKKVKLLKSINNLGKSAEGLNYKYYELNGNIRELPKNLNKKTPSLVGTVRKIDLDVAKSNTDFVLIFDGFIKINKTGVYTFYLSSDDGSKLFIDRKMLIDNNGVHGTIEKSGQIALAEGFYPLRINYFQGIGGKNLKVYIKGPGIKKELIPEELLFHKK